MLTTTPKTITSVREAEDFLRTLHYNGEAYHPEDSAETIINGHTGKYLFTATEAKTLNKLMEQIYNLGDFDPCAFLLMLDKEPKTTKELLRRKGISCMAVGRVRRIQKIQRTLGDHHKKLYVSLEDCRCDLLDLIEEKN